MFAMESQSQTTHVTQPNAFSMYFGFCQESSEYMAQLLGTDLRSQDTLYPRPDKSHTAVWERSLQADVLITWFVYSGATEGCQLILQVSAAPSILCLCELFRWTHAAIQRRTNTVLLWQGGRWEEEVTLINLWPLIMFLSLANKDNDMGNQLSYSRV